ncbi:hypothetical protein SCHPADRAFT_832439, partial [Schizopora paradoxa]
ERREELCLADLASTELKLREGQASDILDALRQQLKVNAMLQIDHEENIWGTRAGNRSMKAINEAKRLKRLWVSEYLAVRSAMLALGLGKQSPFKDLTSDGMYRRKILGATVLGTGTKPDGWIWSMGRVSTSTVSSDLDEDDRVHWFRARASRDRCQEEVLILEEDIRRYVRACVRLAQAWDQVAASKQLSNEPGASAYASRTSDLYRALASKARMNFAEAGGTWSANEDAKVTGVQVTDEPPPQ